MYRVVKQGVVLPERSNERLSSSLQKSLLDDIMNAMDGFEPAMRSYSTRWRNWIAELDLRTCLRCRNLHGKVFDADEMIYEEPPLHDRCRCRIEQLIAVFPGYATRNGLEGADYWLKYYGKLPKYYLTKQAAKANGWRAAIGNLAEVVPGKMIGGDIYKNKNGHLPKAEGRIWYEADINYTNGYRNRPRVLYSSDGLVFVTYDHYETFWEVV